MNGSLLLRVALGLCVAAFVALTGYTFLHAIDDAEQARYARDLRRLQALDTGLNEAVLRSRSGLLPQYDPVVAAVGEIRRLEGTLHAVPRFLDARGAADLQARLDDYVRASEDKERLIETFKTENAVVQNSLQYFPVLATRIIDRVQPKRDGAEFAALVQALSGAVMLFETAGNAEAKQRVLAAQEQLGDARELAIKLGEDRDVDIAIAHSRSIVERKPAVDATVNAVLGAPTARRALAAEDQYSAAYRRATDASLARKQWLFALALAVVVLGLTEVILGIRRSATALEKVSRELTIANQALAVEHEKERQLGELRNRFVAMTSHEFRTPLTTIVSSAELLLQFGERWERERRADHVERIRMAARSMERMLDDVLMIGKAEAGVLRASPSPIRLDEFCKRLVETLEHSTQKSHAIRYTFLGDPDVTMDERLLQHVLGNLLGNAVKYSAPGSEVRFDVRTSGDECQFSVKDEGIGIPAEEIPLLFMSFSRASNAKDTPGSGLGLAVVKKALDVQHGKIEVHSRVGSGSAFTVKIPRRLANVDTTLTP